MNLFLIQAEGVTTGMLIFIGFLVVFFKLPKHMQHWAVNHALVTDLIVVAIMLTIHWGTLGGTMGATVAGILTAGFTTIAKTFYKGE